MTGRLDLPEELPESNIVELATELTIAWLSNPNTRANVNDVPEFLKGMHQAVQELVTGQDPGSKTGLAEEFTPAVTARRSLSSPDHIVSMIDGKTYKTLRRHLARHDLTPEQYRERYNLKPDYPMVAPAYSEVRRSMAKKIGLGQKGRAGRAKTPEVRSAKSVAAPGGRKPSAPKPQQKERQGN